MAFWASVSQFFQELGITVGMWWLTCPLQFKIFKDNGCSWTAFPHLKWSLKKTRRKRHTLSSLSDHKMTWCCDGNLYFVCFIWKECITPSNWLQIFPCWCCQNSERQRNQGLSSLSITCYYLKSDFTIPVNFGSQIYCFLIWPECKTLLHLPSS